MSIKAKFPMGSKVYIVPPIHVEYPEIPVPCKICDSSGMIQIKGESFTCPACHGRTQTDYDNKKMYFTPPNKTPLTIGQIRITQTGIETEVKYMCKETGVNSGTLYSEDRCFSTYEEAIAFIEEANEKMANGVHWSEI